MEVLQIHLTAADEASPEIKQLESALAELGIKTERLIDGFTESERRALGAFGAIADSAKSSAYDIERALIATLGRIKSPEGLAALQAELARLAQSGKLAGQDLERLADWQRELATRAKQAQAAQESLTASLHQQSAAVRSSATSFDTGTNATNEFNHGLSQIEPSVRPIPGAISQLSGMVGQLGATFLTAREALDLNDRFNALLRGFTAVTGSTESARKEMEFVRGVADQLGVSALDLGQSFLKLSASAKGTTLEGAATQEIFRSLASAMSVVGASSADVENALNAVGQMMGKGVVSAEELRGQLGDVLPGAFQQAAQAMGLSTAAFNDLLESGNLLADDFLPKFANQLETTFGGSSLKVESFAAAFERLKNQFLDLASGPIGEGLTKFISTTVDGISALTRVTGGLLDGVGAVTTLLAGLAAGEPSAAFNDFGAAVSNASMNMLDFEGRLSATNAIQRQMEEQTKNLVTGIDKFQQAVDNQNLKNFPANLQEAVAKLRETGDAAEATTLAVKTFMDAPNKNLNIDGVTNLATSLKAVGGFATGAGKEISETLGKELSKLTNEQLTKLEIQARKAMEAAGNDRNARAVFAELGQIIESVVLTRLERLGIDGREALTGLSKAATDAMDDFTGLAGRAGLSAQTIEEAFQQTLKTLDNPAEIDAFENKIKKIGESGKLSSEQVDTFLALLRNRLREVADDKNADKIKEQIEKIASASLAGLSVQEKVLSSQLKEAKNAKALADIKGEEYASRAAVIRIAEIEARQAILAAERKRIELNATKAVLSAIQAEIESRQAMGEAISETDRAGLRSATNAMNVAAIELEAAGLVAEAATRKSAAANLENIGQDKNTQSKDQNTAATQQNTAATNENAQATEESGNAHEGLQRTIASLIQFWRDHTGALSAATTALFDFNAGLSKVDPRTGSTAIKGISDAADEAARKINELTAFVREMDKQILFATGTVGEYMDLIQKSGANAEKAYYEQKLALETLVAQLKETDQVGSIAMDGLIKRAEIAKNSFWLLNDQDLESLKSEIESATDKLKEMRDATQNAKDRLADLNAQLLEAQGEDKKAEMLRQQLDYQQQLAEIEVQRAEAEAAGNRELLGILAEQERVLRQINDAKLRNIQADAESEATGDKVARSWHGAAQAIEEVNQTLQKVKSAADGVAKTDLGDLQRQITSIAESATKLKDAL